MNWCPYCIALVGRHSFPEITVSTILNSVTQPMALSFLTSFPTNAPAIYAGFYGTERFERERNALVE